MRSLESILDQTRTIAADQLGLPRDRVLPSSRVIRDLHCDSLDLVELLMALEDEFGTGWPDRPEDPFTASVFTRKDMTIADMAEVFYLRQDQPPIVRRRGLFRRPDVAPTPPARVAPFTQLDGRWTRDARRPLYEPLERSAGGVATARRQRDGMVCATIPAVDVEFRDAAGKLARRRVESFRIDVEPVSAAAYSRFLNSVAPVSDRMLRDWFVCATDDDRSLHQLIRFTDGVWSPVPGCERWPMILVSWFGANAYSLWANAGDWAEYRGESGGTPSSLPSEDEWEYAARGATWRRFPWGDADATPDRAAFGRHVRGTAYPEPQSLPIEPVNEPTMGRSPFGLRHMAGNVWQWCASEFSPGIRAERGGSWIGPAFLCESSYRRGRVPEARGRCLGFRCVNRL